MCSLMQINFFYQVLYKYRIQSDREGMTLNKGYREEVRLSKGS